jgi:hypothetical protein
MDLLKPDVISTLNEDVWDWCKLTVVLGWVTYSFWLLQEAVVVTQWHR